MQRHLYRVTAFKHVAPFTLTVTFDDGTSQTVDFTPVLHGELYAPLRDAAFFRRVRLDRECGTLVWPNDADFDPATLHDWPTCGPALARLAARWPEPEVRAGGRVLPAVADARASYGESLPRRRGARTKAAS